MALSLYFSVQISNFNEDNSPTGLGAHLTLICPQLNELHLQQPHFQIKSYSEIEFEGDTIEPITPLNVEGNEGTFEL